MRSRLKWVLDLLCVAALLFAGITHWPTAELSIPQPAPEAPSWGTVRDALLDGPDAGEWARHMLAIQARDYQALDPHRMPTWSMLVNGLLPFEPDVVKAGHLSNHLLNLALGLVVFLVGRMAGHRWIGLGAGALAMLATHSLAVSLRFGVDGTVLTMVPLAVLGALLACRKWWLGVLAGIIAAYVTAAHFSTIPYFLPPLVLILIAGGKGTRWLAAASYLAGLSGALWYLAQVFPVPSAENLGISIANGIVPGYHGGGQVSSWAASYAVIQEGVPNAIQTSVSLLMQQIRPGWIPWYPALVLPWLGVVGFGLRRPKEEATNRWKAIWAQCDWPLGLTLLLCLAPLPVFAAAQAPFRYADNLLAPGALLLMRGAASVLYIGVAVMRRWLPTSTQAGPWLAALLGIGVFFSSYQHAAPFRNPLLPTQEELGYWQLSKALADHFPEGSGVACPIREALISSRLVYCPQRMCPETASEASFQHCLGVLKEQCPGDAPVGYVVTSAYLYDPNSPARRDMDQWVAEHWTPIEKITRHDFYADVYAIPRAEIPDLPGSPHGKPIAPPAPTLRPPAE